MVDIIFKAIASHDLRILSSALRNGADPNEPKPDWIRLRPLHAAVLALDEGGSIEALRLLLSHGADVNATHLDIGGGTPLLTALFNGRLDAARFLLEAGADPNVVSEEGDSPLRWSVEEGDHNFARYLITKGADRTIDCFSAVEGM